MARFIETARGSYLNVALVEAFREVGDVWMASMRDGTPGERIGRIDVDSTEQRIQLATATILPAQPGEELAYFSLGYEDSEELWQVRSRVIGWIVDTIYPLPMTFEGVKLLGLGADSGYLLVLPNGQFDTQVDGFYATVEDVHSAMKRLRAEREAARTKGAA